MSNYADFVDDLHAFLTDDPNARVALGLLTDLGRLPDPSLRAGTLRAARARQLLGNLDALPPAGSFDETLDRDLARLTLERVVHEETHTWNGRLHRQQCPRASDAIGDAIFLMFLNDPRPDAARLDDIVARLEAVPAYLTSLLQTLETPVARWVTMDRQKVGGLPDLFATLRLWAEGVEYHALSRLDAAIATATESLTVYSMALERMETTDALHVGPELAQEIVRLRGIDLSLDELKSIARDFLADVNSTLATLRERLVPKYDLPAETTVDELHAFLNERFAVPAETMSDVLLRYEQERSSILAWNEERDLFPIPDDQAMKLLITPSFMEQSIPAGAMMPPPPFREGTATSLVYLTLRPELLSEHTELGIPMMMVHEGIPGHHLQLSWAARHPSVVRRHYDGAHHAEGWTTMLEDYMLDQGYAGELADEVRFETKRDIARIGARVAIDLYFMSGDASFLEVGVDFDRDADDPFAKAGSLLQAVTGFAPERVQLELNWYSQERGYPLSYLAGNRMVWALKEDFARSNPDEEPAALDRRFHSTYLTEGNMPVSYLRRVFRERGLLA